VNGGKESDLLKQRTDPVGSDYGTHAQLKQHLHAFLMAYNFAKRLKTLRGLSPYAYICMSEPLASRFRLNPLHHAVGLNS
jgi:hypothetical protein